MNTYATHSVCKTLIALFTALNMFTNYVSFFTGGNDRGSAGDINGTTIVITLFVSDVEYGWSVKNNEDIERIDNVNEYLSIAGDYLEEQVSNYGGEAEFITDFITHEDLAYYVRVDRNMENVEFERDYDANDEVMWSNIDEYIDVDYLKEKYQADNAVFLAVFNTDVNNPAITCTRNWYPGMESDSEIVFLYYIDYGMVNPPAVYAHEILHTFSAPDLYTTNPEFGITQGTIIGIQNKYPNDIMLTCSDLRTGDYVYDRITNEITEITASYIGLI